MSDGLPDASNPDEAIPWIRENLRDGWTANSDAVRTLLAEYDRIRTELARLHAELDRALSVESAARVFTQHWHDIDNWKIDRDYTLRADLARELGEEEPPERRATRARSVHD